MATTDTNVSQVVVNKLTKAQYTAATKSPTEFYAVTDAKVTNSDIDWSTVTPRIIAAGTINVGAVGASTGKNGYESIPTQDDTNYVVLLTHASQVDSYDKSMPCCRAKETGRFQWVVWNNSSGTTGSIILNYLVVKY